MAANVDKGMWEYSGVLLTLDNVLLPDEKLSPTPSMQDGLDREYEIDLRILGCELIQTYGILLKLPQVNGYLTLLEIFLDDECCLQTFLPPFNSRWQWLQVKCCFKGSTTANHL